MWNDGLRNTPSAAVRATAALEGKVTEAKVDGWGSNNKYHLIDIILEYFSIKCNHLQRDKGYFMVDRAGTHQCDQGSKVSIPSAVATGHWAQGQLGRSSPTGQARAESGHET
jgi:hypothetical protein